MVKAKTTTQMSRLNFNLTAQSIQGALESSRQDQELGTQQIKDLRSELSQNIHELRLRERGINVAEDEQSLRARMDAQFRDIIQHPQVIALELVSKPLRLKVYTTELLCTDPRTDATHSIGKFRIYITLSNHPENDSVVWVNRTRQVETPTGMMEAPHILVGGGACLGNMHGVFEQLIAKGDYSTALVMAIAFIETVNVTDDWGKHVHRWPVVQRGSSQRSS